MPSDSGKDLRQWFLRVGDNTVFGPVSTRGLVLWAEEGRIVSGNSVSTDRKHWSSPESIPELAMKWFVRDAHGTPSGPFNRKAIERLIVEGKIPPETDIFESSSPPDAPPRTPAASAPAAGTATQPDAPPVPRKDESDKEEAPREKIVLLEKNLRKVSTERDRLRSRLAETEKRFRDDFDPLQAEVQRLRRRVEAMHTAQTVHAQQMAALETQRDEARETAKQLRQKLEALQAALEKERTAHAETLRFANQRDAELGQRIRQLSERERPSPPSPSSDPSAVRTAGPGNKESQVAQSAAQVVEILAGHLKEWVDDEQKRLKALNAVARKRHETLTHFLRLLREPFAGTAAEETPRSAPVPSKSAAGESAPPGEAKLREEQLLVRIRKLEEQKTHAENDNTRFMLLQKELSDRLKLREKELEEERNRRRAEADRWEKIEQSLSRRIEELEVAAGSLLETAPDPAVPTPVPPAASVKSKNTAPPPNKKSKNNFRPTPWMRLK